MNQENQLQNRIPVIDKEVTWDKTQVIMSKTNAFGIIEYANEVFVDVSGYEDYELMGQPHNIIRHPDMPKVIFKVLWENLKAGKNFHAIVKNLARSGRYYWVITDFEIAKDENGVIMNYFGRRQAVPQEVISLHIEPLYKKLLQIEAASGVEYSEKYLIGFLEEKKRTYVEYIKELIYEHEKTQSKFANYEEKEKEDEEEEEERGFFRRLFNR
ncbi:MULTISPECIES: PAS domain-containing protein [Flavobacterium]|uniref:Histidine kinase n=2 Tax=Flavobacterium TaxID=237 RepID=A0A226IBJ8_9FLAO|nr:MULTISPECIES: PAS domain-containing protein [Flavobacterium]OXB03573.1 histidine kinase [Flavobacterium oncorhynchi]OXB04766.1 histidine kinase [Flavobacterium plurextorum]PIF59593.1 PAS domain S-box-containing protein [Flavobacterium sp. 2]RXM42871.1 histidine kinase [Flavobacterium sp. YO64]RXM44519.1 histidine kinase [Flavobacterium sp. YO12]